MASTETLHTYSHLWPSSDDKTRHVLDKAFATVDALHAESAHRSPSASTEVKVLS